MRVRCVRFNHVEILVGNIIATILADKVGSGCDIRETEKLLIYDPSQSKKY